MLLFLLFFLVHIAAPQQDLTHLSDDTEVETGDLDHDYDYDYDYEDPFDVDTDENCQNEIMKLLTKGSSAKTAKGCKTGCGKIKDKDCKYKGYNKKAKKCQCKCCDKSPETEAPSSKAPTTKAPTTNAPTTKTSTTKGETSKTPTTKTPTTKVPTTKNPATEAPATKAPVTKAPPTRAPIIIQQGSWEAWGSWGECSRSCGFGRQVRSRDCEGMGCVGLKRQFRSCNTHSCFSPGWKSWSTWGPCDKSCGGGSQTRTRECSSSKGCLGKHMDQRSCGEGSCPVDCEWRNWNAWEPCESENCGKRPPPTKRTRSKYMEASNGGVECQGDQMEIKQCPVKRCKDAPRSRDDYGGSFVPRLENWKDDPHSTWANIDWCKNGSWADSIKVKMSHQQGGGDDTALNGIKLQCRKKSGFRSNLIMSKSGPQGSWTSSEECKGNNFINAINFRFEGMNKEDSTGGNGLDFQCSDGNGYTGTSNDGFTGDWSGYQNCPDDSYVCGVQTKVKDYRKKWDNTALNAIRFFCCYHN